MKLSVKELVKFALFAGIMYASKVAMASLPNMHLLGTFIIAFTIVYKKKAIYPLFGYVFIEGLMAGFATWWLPYLYIWWLLYLVALHLPEYHKGREFGFMMICAGLNGLHGLLFGTLYGIGWALIAQMGFQEFVAYIIAGLPFDVVHCISNIIMGCLVVPLVDLLQFCEFKMKYS